MDSIEKTKNLLQEFKEKADQWFQANSFFKQNYVFFVEFFKKENLEKAEWPDFQKLLPHIYSFNSMPLAGANALGRPNHPIEHYRRSFTYLAHGPGQIVERIQRFYEDEQYKLANFGRGAVSELIGYLFPEQFIFFNARDQFAAQYLGIQIPYSSSDDFVRQLVKFSEAMKPVRDLYQEIVGKRTDLPLNLEVDQFLSWIYQEFSDEEVELDMDIQRSSSVDYWVMAPGEGGEIWDECYAKGIIAIGWDQLGDLRKFESQEELRQTLRKTYKRQSSEKNNARACFDFAKRMKIGDRIFAKQGTKVLLGFGEVASDYFFDDTRSQYKHIRNVNWLQKGEFEVPPDSRFAIKTLTKVTSYPDYIEGLKRILGTSSKVAEPSSHTEINYWWLNANPRLWSLAESKVGLKQTYTSHNEQGNKRQKYKYFQEVKAGDILVGYVTTPDREIAAICRVSKPLHDSPEGERFEFEVIEKLQNPISYENLQGNPALANSEPMINNQGSLFRLTLDEFEIIRSMIDEANVRIHQPAIKYSKQQALESLFMEELKFDLMLNDLRHKKNIILQGPPGVGKTFVAKHLAFVLMGGKDESRVEMIQFHQSYSYEDFIQGFRPNTRGQFDLKAGIFYQFCKKAQRDSEDRPFVFIIDEINRGNLSKIFGELMMLIEFDKRGKEFAIPLTYSQNKDETFYIPSNVHMIGTMNTADRSLAMVDYALRRRFRFTMLRPEFNSPRFAAYLEKNAATATLVKKIIDRMNLLNKAITDDTKNLGSGFTIGHSYFCPGNGVKATDDWYKAVVESEIVPLLREYWFDDEDKVSSLRDMLLN